MRIDCDSQSAIFLAKNPSYHSRTKHIDVQYHFVRDMVESMKVLLEKVDTLENVADSLTKSVSTKKFSWCREAMGISDLDYWSGKFVLPVCKENNKWDNVRFMLYSLHGVWVVHGIGFSVPCFSNSSFGIRVSEVGWNLILYCNHFI